MCDDTTTTKPAPRTFCSVCKLREGIYVDSAGVECCSHAALGDARRCGGTPQSVAT